MRPTLRRATALIVPSGFLQEVFGRIGIGAEIVPNIIDLAHFHPNPSRLPGHHAIVTRNLEDIYDIPTALRAFAQMRRTHPDAMLTVAGSGPERFPLCRRWLGSSVSRRRSGSPGRLDNERIADLYREADLLLNPSTVDNMPISLLEAWASGVAIVSTDVGGIPHMVEDGRTALLVPPREPAAMAAAALRILADRDLAAALRAAGLEAAERYTWPHVRPLLFGMYARAMGLPSLHPVHDMSAHKSAWTRLVAGILFPLHERFKGHSSVQRLRELEVSQWWTREQIEGERVRRLRALLASAQAHVPYYRQLFAATGFEPGAVQSIADLARLPLLTKALIRANVESLKADDAPPLKRYNTGGSSGEPLVFFIGKDRVSHDVAAKWRATRWWGVDIGDPEIVVWGSPIELGAQDRLRGIRDRILRTTLLPAFEMSDAKLDEFVAAIRATRPRMIFGYPSALAHIARHARQRGQRMDDLGISGCLRDVGAALRPPARRDRAGVRVQRGQRLRRPRRRVHRA